jgi:glutathione synthase
MPKMAVIMDPLETIQVKKDSTLALLEEAQKRHWDIYVMEAKDVFVVNGRAHGHMQSLHLELEKTPWHRLSQPESLPLAHMDVILMRQDPPVDMAYMHATHLLDYAAAAGSWVINNPQSLRDMNEKLFTQFFPQCCPPMLISQNMQKLKQFIQEHQKAILKPLDNMGGQSIFLVTPEDPNQNVILETLTNNNQQQIIAQKYIPEINQGDKRILMIDGEPIPYALARLPQNDIRANLAAGGKGVGQPLTQRDRWICQQIAPTLKEKGIMFAGIDVIGDYLTEINVTSPTCIREIDKAFNINISAQFMDKVEAKLALS